MADLLPAPDTIPENMPRMGNRFTRWLGRCLLRLLGWKLAGEIPNEAKLMVAVAPHTSNWDFITAASALLGLGIKLSFLMKKEAFVWPLKPLFKSIGGIPTDRSAPGGIVSQVANWYQCNRQIWVAIAPEGTRHKVGHWKTGFLRIAYTAQVPVLLVAWDYPTKTIRLCKLVAPSGEHERDAQQCKAYIDNHYTGRHPVRQ